MTSSFRALQQRNYRLWVSGTVVSNMGTWFQRTAQDWLVLTELTHHSGLAVGVTLGLQFAPVLLLSVHIGVIADRFPKRRVLACTQSLMGLTALTIGSLVITHHAVLWEVFLAAFVMGLAAAVDTPTRQAFVSEVVDRKDVTSAVSLNTASMTFARLFAPGAAGFVIDWAGTGPAFLINAGSYVAVLIALSRMNAGEFYEQNRRAVGRGRAREGLQYLRQRPDLMVIFFATFMVATFAMNFQVTNALMASGPFHHGASGYGLLGSVQALGSFGAALMAARRDRPRLSLMLGAAASLGAWMTVAAFMPSYWLYALCLIPVGMSSTTFLNSCNTSVQLSTRPELRGRVLSVYVAIQQGTTPIGAPIVGFIGTSVGERWSVWTGAIAALLGAAGAAIAFRRRPELARRYAAALQDAGRAGPPAPTAVVAPAGVAPAAVEEDPGGDPGGQVRTSRPPAGPSRR